MAVPIGIEICILHTHTILSPPPPSLRSVFWDFRENLREDLQIEDNKSSC